MSSLPTLPLDFQLWYAGVLLALVGYTVFAILTFLSVRSLWRTRTTARTFGRRALLPYTCVLFGFGTVTILLDIWASAYALANAARGIHTSTSTPQACSMAAVISGLSHEVPLIISDALLIYRAYVIMQKRWMLMMLPMLLFAASIILAILSDALCANSTPARITIAMNLAGAWIVTSVALNAVLTVMIIVKLWPARAQRKSGSIAAPVGRRAASAMGMLAESAAFYTISGVFFVITQFIGSDYAILFGQIFGVTAFLSTSIITFRIATGIEYVPSGSSGPHFSTSATRWTTASEDNTSKSG